MPQKMFIETEEGDKLLSSLIKDVSNLIKTRLVSLKITVDDAIQLHGALYANLIAHDLLHFHIDHDVSMQDIGIIFEAIKMTTFAGFKENLDRIKSTTLT